MTDSNNSEKAFGIIVQNQKLGFDAYEANIICLNCCHRNRLKIPKGELVRDQLCQNCGVPFKRMLDVEY